MRNPRVLLAFTALVVSGSRTIAAQRPYPRTSYLVTIGHGGLGDSSSGPTASFSILRSVAAPLLLFARAEGYTGSTTGPEPTRNAGAITAGLQLVTFGRWANWLLYLEAGPGTITAGGNPSLAWTTAAGVGIELPLGERTALYADLRLGAVRGSETHRFTGGSLGVRF